MSARSVPSRVGRTTRTDGAQLLIAGSATLASFAILGGILFQRDVDFAAAVLLLATTSICVYCCVVRAVGGWRDGAFWSPGCLVNIACWNYCAKGAFIAFGEAPEFLGNIDPDELVRSLRVCLLCCLLGIVAFNLVYSAVLGNGPVGLGSGRDRLKAFRSGAVLGGFVVVFFLVGVSSATALFYIAGSPFALLRDPHLRSYLTDPVMGLGDRRAFFFFHGVYFAPVASLIWMAWIARGRRLSVWWWGSVGCCLVLLALSSPRSVLIGYVVSLLVGYHLCYRPVHWRLLLAILLVGWSYSYGSRIWRYTVGVGGNRDYAVALDAFSESLSFEGALGFLAGSDLSDVNTMVLIERSYGRVLPYKYGFTFTRIVTGWVPRAFWPDKPADLGLEIEQLWRPGSLSGIPPGYFGEMLMNFGPWGVPMGGALLGFVLAKIYRRLACADSWIAERIIYAALTPRILLIMSSTVANVVFFMVLAGAPVALAAFLAGRKRSIGDGARGR